MKKILLMPNFEGWAFDNIAQDIKKYGKFDYDIKYEHIYRKYRSNVLPKEELDFDQYDWIVIFAPWMAWSNLPLEKTICICHEKFELDAYNTAGYAKVFVTSNIAKRYKDQANIVKVQAGFDPDIFNKSKPIVKHDPIRLGWIGAWSGHKEKKGYEKFFLPLASWYDLRPHLKESNYVESRHEVADYYRSIDVLICTSSWEGYPLPILEAGACGIPVISTKVGIAPEVLPKDQIVLRDVKSIHERLEKGNLLVPDVSFWQWDHKIVEWEKEFV